MVVCNEDRGGEGGAPVACEFKVVLTGGLQLLDGSSATAQIVVPAGSSASIQMTAATLRTLQIH